MSRPALHRGALTLTLLLSSACTGSLRYKIDDSTIADLPQSAKQNLSRWQSDRERAQSEKDKAQTELMAARHALEDAQLERLAARLGAQKLLSDLDKEQPRQQAALLSRLQAELRVAKLAEDAAEAHVRFCKQRRLISEAQLTAAATHLQLAEARVEREQARLAARYGRLPAQQRRIATFDEQVAQAEAEDNRRREEIFPHVALSSTIEQEYNQKLNLYTQARLQTPSFTPFTMPLSSSQPLPVAD
jgi:uncharacterized protein (DUF3084 family)